MKKLFLAFAAMLMAFSVSAAEPNIYASGLKAGAVADGKVEISYLLNAPATALELQLIGADNAVAKTFNLTGDDLAKGKHTVSIDLADVAAGTYTWAVKASAAANEAFAEVFKDSGSYVRLQTIIDNNPESPFFGQIYGQNKAPATYLHAWNADYTSLKSGFTADITWGNSSGRPAVDANGKVWLAEYSDDHSGVFVLDPATWKVTNFFEGTQNVGGGLLQKDGVDVGGSTPGVAIYGTGADMKLYVANEDAGTTTGTLLYKNGYNVYNIGAQENPYLWTTAPSLGVNAAHGNGDRSIVATKHGVWLSINRTSDYGPTYPSLDFYDHAGTRVWYSNSTDDQIKSSNGGGIAILSDENGDEKQLAIIGDASTIQIYDLTWTDNEPILTLSASYSVGYSHLRTIHFDYAGNLVTSAGLSNDGNTLVVFALPKADNSCVTPAPKANTITVAAAAAADTYVVAGVEALCGSNWSATDQNNLMTEANGVYTKVYTNVPVGKNYQLKVVKNGNDWIGDATGNNVTFHIIEACDVTVTFNPTTSEITVTGTGVTLPTGLEIEAIYAVGNGNGAEWLNGANWDQAAAANKMAEVSPFVYQIAYTGVPAGNYELKFAANGAWTDSWGAVGDYTISSSIEDYDAAYKGGNIKINNTFAKADITLEIDLSKFDYATKTGAKFSLTITEQKVETPTEEVLATIVFKDSGKDSDGSNAKTAIADLIADGDEYVSDITKAEKIYNAKTGFGIKGGASSVKGELTLKLAKELKATKIVLHAAAYDEGKGIIVNGQEITLPTKDVLADHTITLDGTALSEIAIAGNAEKARFYIHSLTIYGYPAAPVAATAVKLDKETAEVELYKSLQLTATLEPAEATNEITWKSSDDKIATVDARGLVTPVAVGEVTITATAAEGIEASCVVAVKEATVLTAAQAAEIAKTVGANNELAPNGQYVVEAYVYSASELNTQFGNMELGLADSRDADTALLIAYRTIPADVENLPAVGDKVRVIGDLTKYNEKNQVAAGSKTTVIEKAPVPLSFELNGGEQVIPVNNDSLYELFKEDYKAFKAPTQPENYATIAGTTGANGVAGYATNGIIGFLTTNDYGWKWLGDYIIQTTPAMAEQTSETYWRYEAQGFFSMLPEGSFWAQTGDYAEAGKTEVWLPYYKFGYAPTKEGHKFLGWFDNAACEGEALTEKPAGGTLYAGWEELVSEPTELWITPNWGEINAGETLQLTASFDVEGEFEVTWTSSREDVTVDATGLVTVSATAADGQAVITATYGELKGEAYLTILSAGLQDISVTPATAELAAGDSIQLTATANPAGEYTFIWWSENEEIATVDDSGWVHAGAPAADTTVKIYVKAQGYDEKQAYAEITVKAATGPTEMWLNPGWGEIAAEETFEVTVNFDVDVDEEAFVAGREIVKNREDIMVMGGKTLSIYVPGDAADGQFELTVKYNGLEATGYYTILGAGIQNISIDPATATLAVGDSVQLTATVNPEGEYDLIWWSENEALATVNAEGWVKALAVSATPVKIYVKAQGYDEVKAYAEITITESIVDGLENVTINGEVRKVVRDGQVIIIRDNQEYNVLGTKLQ